MRHKVRVRKLYPVKVHRLGDSYGEPGEFIENINVRLRAECIGNFNPVFCTYKGEKRLVKSTEGDLSDPFRREESYLESLYIEV